MISQIKKKISIVLAVAVFISQVSFVATIMFVPKQVQACQVLGTGPTCNFTLGDVPKYIEKVVEGILVRVGTQYANKYLTKFVDKLQDKYRIKDFLFYDRYLSNYYISNLILRNVDDPDLRRAYELMLGIAITGDTQGYSGANPRQALIPRLKEQLAKVHAKRGGITRQQVFNPTPGMTETQKWNMAKAYFTNPEEFSDDYVYGQFGAFQSEATTASQIEILVGNGLKAGRIIGGTCELPQFQAPIQNRPSSYLDSGKESDKDNILAKLLVNSGLVYKAQAQTLPSTPTVPISPVIPTAPAGSAKDPVGCAALGGTWQASALDQARSLITNPTAFTEKQLQGAVEMIFKNNYDPTNIYTQIGQALGDFIYNKLNLNEGAGVFEEVPGNAFSPGRSPESLARDVDLDADGIPDGQDNDKDRKLDTVNVDVCYHERNGVMSDPPSCALSTQVPGSSYFTPICKATDDAIAELTRWYEFQDTHRSQIQGSADFKQKEDALIWGQHGSVANGKLNILLESIKDFNNPNFDSNIFVINQYNVYLDRVNNSLFSDADIDLQTGFGDGGGGFDILRDNTLKMLNYVKEFRVAIQRCDAPNATAAGALPDPDLYTGDNALPQSVCQSPYRFIEAKPELNLQSKYLSDVQAANSATINENPTLASQPRDDESVGAQLVEIVVGKLRSQGYKAGTAVNCNGVQHPDENILVYKTGDGSFGEYFSLYRVESGIDYAEAARRRDYGIFVGKGSLNMCETCQ